MPGGVGPSGRSSKVMESGAPFCRTTHAFTRES
jgi:hypothetical protein